MKSSPLARARKGLWRVTLGIQGIPPRRISSMLGCVAAVIAIVSPSQPRPAVIQSTCISFIGGGVEWGTSRCSDELGMRLPLRKSDLHSRLIRCPAKRLVGGPLRRDCTESNRMCLVFLSLVRGYQVRVVRMSLQVMFALHTDLTVSLYSLVCCFLSLAIDTS